MKRQLVKILEYNTPALLASYTSLKLSAEHITEKRTQGIDKTHKEPKHEPNDTNTNESCLHTKRQE